jgi:TetR/AcrR family transcriptional regulator, regulator of biofilm formation and stress response
METASAAPRGTARREALLEAALRIVAEEGPGALTHRHVAEVAGLPLASTTYWFSAKEELMAGALELAAQRDLAAMGKRARPPFPAGPLEAAVAVLCGPLEEGPRGRRGHLLAEYSLWLEAARQPELREITRRWASAYQETVAALLAQAGSRSSARDAELLVAAADGLTIDRLAAGVACDIRPQLRRLGKALLDQS